MGSSRYPTSDAHYARAETLTPTGAQTSSRSPGRLGPLGAYPLYAERGQGPWLWCIDGHRYADWMNANGSVTLGHADPAIVAAVHAELRRGSALSLPTRLEAEVAARLISVIPCADRVRFVKTGSEAAEAAIRVARMATGRSVIVTGKPGYHSWHSWSMPAFDMHPGVPDFYANGLRTFTFNDLDSLDAVLDDDVALVMLEPMRLVPPASGFLEGVLARAHRSGALVCFDEVVCGNRWHAGGAQATFGVTPDLAIFGKALANGLPLGVLCGRTDVMTHAWAISSTFGGETVALAACLATLDAYADPARAILTHLWNAGRQLMDTWTTLIAEHHLPATVIGWPCLPALDWTLDDADRDRVLVHVQRLLAAHGVLAPPGAYLPSAALAQIPEAMSQTLAAFGAVFNDLARVLATPAGLAGEVGDQRLHPAIRTEKR